MYNVLIVDEEPLVRSTYKAIIDWHRFGFNIAGEVGNGKEALEYIKYGGIDILVTGIVMPEMDGLTLIQEVRKVKPELKIVVLSASDEYNLVRQAFIYGAQDYLLKTDFEPEELIIVLQKVCADLHAQVTQPLDEPVLKAKQYIDQYYIRSITLQEVARHAYISPSYLCKLFSEEIGKNFTDYINELRIEKAEELLMRTNKRVYEIAEAVGFESPEYFCKVFKKMIGESPQGYKKIQKNNKNFH